MKPVYLSTAVLVLKTKHTHTLYANTQLS